MTCRKSPFLLQCSHTNVIQYVIIATVNSTAITLHFSPSPAKVTFTIMLSDGHMELPGHVDKEQSHQVCPYNQFHHYILCVRDNCT